MRPHRRLTSAAILAGVSVIAALTPAAFAGPDSCHTPGSESYPSHDCKVERLQERGFAVVAVVDAGINPYHLDFRLPPDEDLLGVHPSEYIEGYPTDASALGLSLDAPDYNTAEQRDGATWAGVREGELRWVPGTNIIGTMWPMNGTPPLEEDEAGNGTAIASLAGGLIHGPRSSDILLVAVASRFFDDGVAWAAHQPWIDVIIQRDAEHVFGISTGGTNTLDFGGTGQVTRDAVAAGKVVCAAGQNQYSPQITADSQGPSWQVNVGAASPLARGERLGNSFPNDVLGVSVVSVAARDSMEAEVPGYSPISPTYAGAANVCGQFARTLARVRNAVGDHVEGQHQGSLAVGGDQGYLDDGKLTRVELEDALQSTAVPAATHEPLPDDDPFSIPGLPVAGFVRNGYGIVDTTSADQAFKVIMGTESRPERPLEDAWMQQLDSGRDKIWGPLLPLPSPPQPPQPQTRVETLHGGVGGQKLAVSGSAVFEDVPVRVAEDFDGDHPDQKLGADITEIWMSAPDPTAKNVVFTMRIPTLPASGETPWWYLWPFKVGKQDSGLWIEALRGQCCSADPAAWVKLYEGFDAVGSRQLAELSADMSNGALEITVPLNAIGAKPGSTISRGAGGHYGYLGSSVRGVYTRGGDRVWWDRSYVIPEATVRLGLAPVSIDAADVPLDTPAVVDVEDGTFAAELKLPSNPGPYRLVARACYGPHNCAIKEEVVQL